MRRQLFKLSVSTSAFSCWGSSRCVCMRACASKPACTATGQDLLFTPCVRSRFVACFFALMDNTLMRYDRPTSVETMQGTIAAECWDVRGLLPSFSGCLFFCLCVTFPPCLVPERGLPFRKEGKEAAEASSYFRSLEMTVKPRNLLTGCAIKFCPTEHRGHPFSFQLSVRARG
jgi:hypothetical protein